LFSSECKERREKKNLYQWVPTDTPSFLKVRKGKTGTAVLVQAGPENCTQGTEHYALFEIRGLYGTSARTIQRKKS